MLACFLPFTSWAQLFVSLLSKLVIGRNHFGNHSTRYFAVLAQNFSIPDQYLPWFFFNYPLVLRWTFWERLMWFDWILMESTICFRNLDRRLFFQSVSINWVFVSYLSSGALLQWGVLLNWQRVLLVCLIYELPDYNCTLGMAGVAWKLFWYQSWLWILHSCNVRRRQAERWT